MAIFWTQGDTNEVLPVVMQTSAGTAINLSTALSVGVRLRRSDVPDNWWACAGSPTITNASAGQFSFQFAASDVATPGQYSLVAFATFPGAPALVHTSSPTAFTIQPGVYP